MVTSVSHKRTVRPLPRVLYVLSLSPGKKYGSMEEQLVLLGQEFARAHSHFIPLFNCSAEASDVSQFTARGVQAECLDLNSFHMTTLWKLIALIRKHNIQLVHWNFVHPLNNPYVWGLTVLAPWLRHWYTDHISRIVLEPKQLTGWQGWLKGRLLRRYSRVVCVSDYIKTCLERTGGWSNLTTVRHFINTERFAPDEATRRQIRQERGVVEKFVLVTVGNLISEKGIDVAVRALTRLPPRVVLWILGDGPERDSLRRLAVELGVSDRVELLGLQRNVQPYLQAADVFVCPSRWGEAAGLVNLEAQSCGLPMLGSRIGGIPEYLLEGRSGWLFPPEDATGLAELVTRLESNPTLCRQMGEAARALALERFSPEARLPQVLSLYREI